MERLFGTDGVRGIANEMLDSMLAFKLGKAGAYVLNKMARHKPRIIVGTDTRISCDMLECAIMAGICSTGAEAVCVGVIPTPAVAYLVRALHADAGIMISASHNPFEYNGIKFFNSDGFKLSDSIEDMIEKHLDPLHEIHIPKAKGENLGRKTIMNEASGIYSDYVKGIAGSGLDGMKIVIDCANGAASNIAPELFRSMGAEVIPINDSPDGMNINKKCGSTHLESLQRCMKDSKADLGLAFDGDADRLLAVDEKGGIIDGDIIMGLLAAEMMKSGTLAQNTLTVTVMSNIGLDRFAEKAGIKLVKTNVGDRYVLEAMLEGGYSIGGEQSGHIILLGSNTTGDGMIVGLKLAGLIRRSGIKSSELAKTITIYPQVMINASVNDAKKNTYMYDKEIAGACSNLKDEFAGEGRVLIRPSGTEPLVRVMIEGKDRVYIEKKARELAELIERKLS